MKNVGRGVLEVAENAVIIHGDAASLLPPVLQGIKGKINRLRNESGFIFKNAEYAAFFMN
jgi:hypothetical protein